MKDHLKLQPPVEVFGADLWDQVKEMSLCLPPVHFPQTCLTLH